MNDIIQIQIENENQLIKITSLHFEIRKAWAGENGKNRFQKRKVWGGTHATSRILGVDVANLKH